jgi:hypothetical protein
MTQRRQSQRRESIGVPASLQIVGIDHDETKNELNVNWEAVSGQQITGTYDIDFTHDQIQQEVNESGQIQGFVAGTTTLPYDGGFTVLITGQGTITANRSQQVSSSWEFDPGGSGFDMDKIDVDYITTDAEAAPGDTISVDYGILSSHSFPVQVDIEFSLEGQVVETRTDFIRENSNVEGSFFVRIPDSATGTVNLCADVVSGQLPT